MSFASVNLAKAQRAKDAGYVVRSMRVADAERIAQVHVQVWREAYQSLMPPEYLEGLEVEEFTTQWRTRLAKPASPQDRHLVGVHPSGNIVGIGSSGPNRDPEPPTEWELWAINLLATEHGTGLADLLMAALVGGRPCSLWVLPDNTRALTFYVRYGFVADGLTKSHPPTGRIETRLVRKRTP